MKKPIKELRVKVVGPAPMSQVGADNVVTFPKADAQAAEALIQAVNAPPDPARAEAIRASLSIACSICGKMREGLKPPDPCALCGKQLEDKP